MDIIDLLDKANRIADQVIVGEVRVSRNIAMGVRLVRAAKQEFTGETEQAVLTRLEEFGNKLQDIVGVR